MIHLKSLESKFRMANAGTVFGEWHRWYLPFHSQGVRR